MLYNHIYTPVKDAAKKCCLVVCVLVLYIFTLLYPYSYVEFMAFSTTGLINVHVILYLDLGSI